MKNLKNEIRKTLVETKRNKENKIIEVKSIWTYNVNLEKNILKQKASINNGYNFEFWIFNNKGQKINQI